MSNSETPTAVERGRAFERVDAGHGANIAVDAFRASG